MVYLFLFFLCICCGGYYCIIRQTPLGDKLGIKELPKHKLQAPSSPIVRLNYFKRLVGYASDRGAIVQESHISLLAIVSATLVFIASVTGFRSVILASIATAVAFFGIPRLYTWHTVNKQREKISEQLGETIMSLTSALRAGKTLVEAIGTVGDDIPAPLGSEFQKVYDTVKHGGEELGSALNKMLARTGNHYILFKLVLAIIITRQTGGNIAGALDGVGRMVENERFTQEFAKSHSSHGKMVAVVFNLIIIGVVFNMARSMSGSFTDFFLSDIQGRLLLFGCITVIIFGWLVIYRMLSTVFDV